MWDDAACCASAPRWSAAWTPWAHHAALRGIGVADGDRRYNLTWHDWLNLESLVDISRVITVSALARENSRGAHFREDFPEPGDLHASRYTRVSAGRRSAAGHGSGFLRHRSTRPVADRRRSRHPRHKARTMQIPINKIEEAALEIMRRAAIEIPDDYKQGILDCARPRPASCRAS